MRELTKENKLLLGQFALQVLFFLLVICGNALTDLRLACGCVSIACGCASYFLAVKDRASLINFEGLFSLSWMAGAGLSLLGLHPVQEAWGWKTVVIVGAAPLLLMAGLSLSRRCEKTVAGTVLRDGAIAQKRANLVLIIASALVLAALGLDLLYSKELPILSSSMAAYSSFGMPMVHYMTVSCCLLPVLYAELFKRGLIDYKKNVVATILVLICAVIPVLIVSRQLMALEVFLLLASFLADIDGFKKIRVRYLVIAAVVFIVAWKVISGHRNQSTAYLASVFLLPSTTTAEEMSLWQPYLYVAFNFDNLNYLVEHFSSYTMGANTLFPAIALLKLKSFFPAELFSTTGYMALPTYTTFTFLLPAYMDFGVIGALVYPFLIGLFAGRFDVARKSEPSICGKLAKLLIAYSLVISFFVSELAQPVFWVYLLLLLFVSLGLGETRFSKLPVRPGSESARGK